MYACTSTLRRITITRNVRPLRIITPYPFAHPRFITSLRTRTSSYSTDATAKPPSDPSAGESSTSHVSKDVGSTPYGTEPLPVTETFASSSSTSETPAIDGEPTEQTFSSPEPPAAGDASITGALPESTASPSTNGAERGNPQGVEPVQVAEPQANATGDLEVLNSHLLNKLFQPEELRPLMQVPSLPTYPSPWIMKIEAYKYLLPLYERGWYISEEPLPTGQTRTWPTLKKVFRFKRRVSSAVFIKEVADTMIRLQHDATLLLEGRTVTLETYTHSAHPPGSLNRSMSVPGVTLHDANLAIEVEKLWIERCEDGQAQQNSKPQHDPPRRKILSFVVYARSKGYIR